jgi:aromatic ring-cleaving dioxygenase
MTSLDPAEIESWHAHVYFDAATRDAAWALRSAIESHFAYLGSTLQMGRFHERPVGPHPKWSYQLAFARERLTEIAEWLALNHGELDVFIHPNTADSLRDHRDCAMWIGHSHTLNLAALGD